VLTVALFDDVGVVGRDDVGGFGNGSPGGFGGVFVVAVTWLSFSVTAGYLGASDQIVGNWVGG